MNHNASSASALARRRSIAERWVTTVTAGLAITAVAATAGTASVLAAAAKQTQAASAATSRGLAAAPGAAGTGLSAQPGTTQKQWFGSVQAPGAGTAQSGTGALSTGS